MLKGSRQDVATDSCQIKCWYYILFAYGSSKDLWFKEITAAPE
jgi:hypothetical protein